MTNQKNILIVESNKDDQHLVALLFKRGLHSDLSLSITYASCLTEARNLLSSQQFTVITLDGEFPSFVDSRLGHRLIPFIKETQKESPVIIMLSGERLYVKEGLENGATHGFTKQQLQGDVKFNESFELVAFQQAVSLGNYENFFSTSVVFPQIFFGQGKVFSYTLYVGIRKLEAWTIKSIVVVEFIHFRLLIPHYMKVVYPKNIKRGLLAGMTFSIGPLNISIVQMFVLALGVALALAAFNGFSEGGSKAVGIFVALLILIIFIVIAFFKVSELGLLAYLAKLIRNNFFDAKKKFQVNYEKKNPLDIMIQESKTKEEKQIIEQKESTFDQQHLTDIEKKGLI